MAAVDAPEVDAPETADVAAPAGEDVAEAPAPEAPAAEAPAPEAPSAEAAAPEAPVAEDAPAVTGDGNGAAAPEDGGVAEPELTADSAQQD